MSDDGYTLAESLAALVMVGLAVGGLGQATWVIGRLNGSTSEQVTADRRSARVQRSLDGLMRGAGPFRAGEVGEFSGQAASFTFACEGGRRCGAELVTVSGGARLITTRAGRAVASHALGQVEGARFQYMGGETIASAWPPAIAKPSLTLEVVALVVGPQDKPSPLATATIWSQQLAVCAFDVIAGDCRVDAQ